MWRRSLLQSGTAAGQAPHAHLASHSEPSSSCGWPQGREVRGQARAAQKTIEEFASSYRLPDAVLDEVRDQSGEEGGHHGGQERPASPDEIEQDGGTVVTMRNIVRAPVATMRAAAAGALRSMIQCVQCMHSVV